MCAAPPTRAFLEAGWLARAGGGARTLALRSPLIESVPSSFEALPGGAEGLSIGSGLEQAGICGSPALGLRTGVRARGLGSAGRAGPGWARAMMVRGSGRAAAGRRCLDAE
ncbi:hypothetical protein chiPu_0006506 [Chiloscyllium punctatum]|uniref:Uncharacterized protein n=1 Tax=Chiloscyllium punctatum TaxID=137246 RepID=A0A401SCJ6_CHIPU|nr:hypothetical protein [Chiloscyllium punctatum]